MYSASATVVSVVFRLSSGLLAISIFVSGLEYLSLWREFAADGAFSWRILGTRSARPKSLFLRTSREMLLGQRGTMAMLIVRLACAIVLALGAIWNSPMFALPTLLGILFTGMLLTYRTAFGTDGSDQMSTVLAAGLAVAASHSTSLAWSIVGFGFIAAQSCLSYFTSGVAKAISPVWRDGTAIYKVMNTGVYGHPGAATLLRRLPFVSVVVCWSVIIFEAIFPITLLGPAKLTLGFLAIGAIFHIGNALFMGLNTFLWSFLATYPAVWCSSLSVRAMVDHALGR